MSPQRQQSGKATSNIEIDNLKKDAAKAYLARDDEKKRANSNRDKVEEKVRVVKYLEGQNETLRPIFKITIIRKRYKETQLTTLQSSIV